jgi:hypothetical protein
MIALGSEKITLQLVKEKVVKLFSGTSFFSALIETAMLTGLGFLLGYWFSSDNIFFAIPGFTWLVIGPLLVALRYGFFFTLISIFFTIIILWIAQAYHLSWAVNGSISSLSMMLLWVGFIAGSFRSYWGRQESKLEATVNYLDKQLIEMTNAYSLTKISHDRLQEMVVSRVSLRDTVLDVRRQILNVDVSIRNGNLTDVAPIVLRALEDYGDIQLASLHHVKKNKVIDSTVVGAIGKHKVSIKSNDALLQKAIESKKTVSLKGQLGEDSPYQGSLVLAVPLVDSTGKIWGIVAVHQMPFRSYRPENLKLIATLAGYVGDLIGRKNYSLGVNVHDTELHLFLIQVQRCIQDISSYGLPSAIIGFEFKNKEHYKTVSALLLHRKRGLDQSWMTRNRHDNKVLWLLLPLTAETELEAYKVQILTLLRDRFAFKNFQDAGISFHQRMLFPYQGAADALESVAQKLEVDMGWSKGSAIKDIYVYDQ